MRTLYEYNGGFFRQFSSLLCKNRGRFVRGMVFEVVGIALGFVAALLRTWYLVRNWNKHGIFFLYGFWTVLKHHGAIHVSRRGCETDITSFIAYSGIIPGPTVPGIYCSSTSGYITCMFTPRSTRV